MKNMLQRTLVIALLACVTPLVWAQTPAAQKSAAAGKVAQELTQLGTELEAGLRRNDPAVVERHFAPAWLFTSLEGQTSQARAAIIAGFKTGALKVEEWQSEPPQMQIYGDTVVSSALTTFKGMSNGQPVNARFRATSTFVKQNGRWQVVATQHTPLSPATDKNQAEQEVTKLHQDWLAALLRGDAETVKRLLADDYLVVTEAGKIQDKAQVLAGIKPPPANTPAVEVKPAAEGKIRLYGETAITTGGLRFTSAAGSQTLFYSTVTVKRQGQWQVVSAQLTNAQP